MLPSPRFLPRTLPSVFKRHLTVRRCGRVGRKRRRSVAINTPYFCIADEVRDAVETGRPVVALETTIYTHGFPYPDSAELASSLETAVRDHGAVPATIGVVDGRAWVGLSPAKLERLTAEAAEGGMTMKVSRRDLGYICGMGRTGKWMNGGTTIAGTMALAKMALIDVLATGGLGGVHRGGQDSFDISADLTELGRTRIAVISSGCKSFLDIPRTLEYLETQGVPVATFADGRDGARKTIDYPAFWSRDSGVKSPMVVRDEREAASIIHTQNALGLGSGLHFANPIPAKCAIPKSEMDIVIAEALLDADRQGIAGKDNTPFVLNRIKELTKGKSVVANRALIMANVVRGAKVAVELSHMSQGLSPAKCLWTGTTRTTGRVPAAVSTGRDGREGRGNTPSSTTIAMSSAKGHASLKTRVTSRGPVDILVAGSLAVDVACDYTPLPGSKPTTTASPQLHTSNPAVISQTLGGVGYNVARAAQLTGASVRLCSAVGDDLGGQAALETMKRQGMSTDGVVIREQVTGGGRTAQYIAINDTNKDLVVAMADMTILEGASSGSEPFRTTWLPTLESSSPTWLALDTNWDALTLNQWLASARALGTQVALEPVSAAKSTRLFQRPSPAGETRPLGVYPDNHIHLCTPNVLELSSMHTAARDTDHFERQDWWRVIDSLGISSAGARDRLVQMTTEALVDEGVPQMALQLLPFTQVVCVKLGAAGVLLVKLLSKEDASLRAAEEARYILSRSDDGGKVGGVYMRLFPAGEKVADGDVVSVNGVGDTFLGVLLAGLVKGEARAMEDLVQVAQKGSVMTLKSRESVCPELGLLRDGLGAG